MAILQKLVSHGGKRLSLYADKGCHLRKMAALLFPEESSTILRLQMPNRNFLNRMDLISGFRLFETQGSSGRPFSFAPKNEEPRSVDSLIPTNRGSIFRI